MRRKFINAWYLPAGLQQILDIDIAFVRLSCADLYVHSFTDFFFFSVVKQVCNQALWQAQSCYRAEQCRGVSCRSTGFSGSFCKLRALVLDIHGFGFFGGFAPGLAVVAEFITIAPGIIQNALGGQVVDNKPVCTDRQLVIRAATDFDFGIFQDVLDFTLGA